MKNFDYLEFGSAPVEEECAQVGQSDYREKVFDECNRFILLLREIFGDEPEGSRLMIKRNEHDFGLYYEVACKFDITKTDAVDYAYAIEGNMPKRWS